MLKNLLILDANLLRGKFLHYRLGREARCDWARTPETAFEHVRDKLRAGGTYDAIVLPAGQMRFAQGIESIFSTFGPADGSGPCFVVITDARSLQRENGGKEEKTQAKPSQRVVQVSGVAEASRAALGH